MTKLPQVSHERVVRALKRAGYYVLRRGTHISMTDAKHIVIIPRQHIIKPGTLKQFWTQLKYPPNASGNFSSVASHPRLPRAIVPWRRAETRYLSNPDITPDICHRSSIPSLRHSRRE